jgi:hypothetical protein
MSVINEPIGTQSFELIRDRIAEILAEELDMQNQLTYNPLMNAVVYVERFIPFNESELPAVNVQLARTGIDGHDVLDADGTNYFFIDVYTKAATIKSDSGRVDGGGLSVRLMHKLIGVIRAILEDSRYKTLGFMPPFIHYRRIVEFKFANPKVGDLGSTSQGRITLEVKASLENGVTTPRLIRGYETVVKLHETEEGYYYFGGADSTGLDYILDQIL